MRRVVEDEALIRLTIVDALEDVGSEVIVAADAEEPMAIIIRSIFFHPLFGEDQTNSREKGASMRPSEVRSSACARAVATAARY
jgi:DNA-binding NtrC family response regulator